MPGKNQVTLTFGGDSTSLDKTIQGVNRDLNSVSSTTEKTSTSFSKTAGLLTKTSKGIKDGLEGVIAASTAMGVSFPGEQALAFVAIALDFTKGAKDLAEGLGGLLEPALTKVKTAMGFAATATEGEAAATGEAEAAQLGLNAALLANPIVLIIAGLVALGVGFYEAYEHVKVFRDAVNDVASVLKTVVLGAFRAVETAVTTVIDFVKDHWKLILGILTGPFGLLVAAVASNFGAVKKVITDGISAIKGFFSDAGSWLLDAGKAIVDGLKNGIANAWGDIKGVVSDGVNKVKGWVKSGFGIFSPSKVFKEYGQNLIDGLVLGITQTIPSVKKAIDGLSQAVKDQLAAVGTKIASAQQLAQQVAGGFTATLSADGAGVLANLKTQLDQTQALQRDLKLLQSEGLSKSLLDQLAAGGVGSLAAADQLAIGGKSAVSQANVYAAGIGSSGAAIAQQEVQRDLNVTLAANLTTVLKVDGKTLADIVQTALLKKKRTSGSLGLS